MRSISLGFGSSSLDLGLATIGIEIFLLSVGVWSLEPLLEPGAEIIACVPVVFPVLEVRLIGALGYGLHVGEAPDVKVLLIVDSFVDEQPVLFMEQVIMSTNIDFDHAVLSRYRILSRLIDGTPGCFE